MVKRAKAESRTAPSITCTSCLWLGPHQAEFAWVLQKLAPLWPTLVFDDPRLTETFGTQMSPSHVLVASRNRTDPIEPTFDFVHRHWPKAQPVLILGAWWPGHRRCQPLPETIPSFYWYQWWDALLPRFASTTTKPLPTVANGKGGLAPRLQRILNADPLPEMPGPRLALITCGDRTADGMWETVLQSLGYLTVFRRPDDPIPWPIFRSIFLTKLRFAWGESQASPPRKATFRKNATFRKSVGNWPRNVSRRPCKSSAPAFLNGTRGKYGRKPVPTSFSLPLFRLADSLWLWRMACPNHRQNSTYPVCPPRRLVAKIVASWIFVCLLLRRLSP